MIEHDDFFVIPYVDVKNIEKTLKSLKRKYHLYNTDGEDTYFVCPVIDGQGECTCGLEQHNKNIDTILEIFKK